jgi:hypothetical protein
MVARKLTFGEIAWASGFTLMTKQRLKSKRTTNRIPANQAA